ncbi:hypothetical protein MNR01_06915 [Lysobacter sp. S4-A87]|uniref:hypothetical protein n=1 Tax=Lysobacter sp. S4-A87 TaxID=2925843 RepID=UPI001F53AE00|nr:hypothetical protein [Lysobacter sp. S4-A87]UNK50731.1 hypothetical protein MNR01_06915 [Lysobacter sp. S4-A87]
MQIRNLPSMITLVLAAVLAAPAALAQRTETPETPPPETTPDTTPKPMSFQDMDVNADSKVSKDEAAVDARLTSQFAKADRNGDGQLSETEYAASQQSGASQY